MTYETLKHLIRALLIGDNQLTENKQELLALISYGFVKVANESMALKLSTEDPKLNILRSGPGNTFVRMPSLPAEDGDVMDIDLELCYPLARYIASFVSREKGGIHIKEAKNLINEYNRKVYTYMDLLDQRAEQQEMNEGYIS